MSLLVDCSGCQTPLHLPPGATRIRCSLCLAFTLIAPDPHHHSFHHAHITPPPIYPPPSPSPFPFNNPPPPQLNHAPSLPFSHEPPEPYTFNHSYSLPSFNHHEPSGPPPPVHGQKRAVIVGVTYKGTESELQGCINDAKCMKFMLINRFHFPESCILMLTEEEADPARWPTKNNITMALHWLVLGCKPGDSLVFHFSGHGSNLVDNDEDEVDGFDEVLLPMDHETSGVIVDDEINAIIVRPLPYGVRLHAIIDACHSGTVLDLPYLCRMDRLGSCDWEDQRPQGMWKGTSGGEVFAFTGCDDDQTSADTTQLAGNTWTGAMTYAFIQAIERGHGKTYGSLLSAMRLTIHEVFDKDKGKELMKQKDGDDLLATLLGMLILGATSFEEVAEDTEAPAPKTQVPQLSANEEFDVYGKSFYL